MDLFNLVETERLRLRCVAISDAAMISSHLTPAIASTMGSWRHPMSLPEALERIEALRSEAGKGMSLPIVLEARGDRRFVGVLTVDVKSDSSSLGKLGYWIAEPFQGKGFAQEAVLAATEMALRLLPITSVEAAVEVENAASIAVLKRCGFEEVDVREVYAPSKGALFLCAIYQKIASRTSPQA